MAKKGQAAIEYLMTHGWAILSLTAILVILYSMGVFSPSKYVRQECYFQPDFYCQSFRLVKGESQPYILTFSINNGLGFDILVDEVNITTADLGKGGEYTHSNLCSTGICVPGSGLIKQGELLNVTFPITSAESLPERGAMRQMKVSIAYRNCKTDSSYAGTPETCSNGSPHIVSGRIVANVE
ncbi:MAG: hypothetical protein V1909_02070 [Candidatus Micrarchaeota archaeon]